MPKNEGTRSAESATGGAMGRSHTTTIEGRQLTVQMICGEQWPGGQLVIGLLDLCDVDSYVGTAMAHGRIAIDIGDDLTVIGTQAELLDLSATITSLAYSAAREKVA